MNLESSVFDNSIPSHPPDVAANHPGDSSHSEPSTLESNASPTGQLHDDKSIFVPIEPQTLAEAGLSESDVSALVLKFLNAYGEHQGRVIGRQLKLPFGIVQEVLTSLKHQMLVSYNGVAAANDYTYDLTENGHEKARRLAEICTYCGAAPVGFDQYVESVHRQSLKHQRLSSAEVERAFQELLLPRELLAQLGQAVNSGRCMFLYGESGNGKTSIATRCIRAYDSAIWIPRTLTIGGEIIRLFDPTTHEEMPTRQNESLLKKSVVDERWVLIRRPRVTVGGELNFSQLEFSQNRLTGVLEAPIHMKSNSGSLVVDDFGRQQLSVPDLLNRWIIPLENGMDFIRLPNGRKIEAPFDQLLIFSTNLGPDCLEDDAFFRRVPYKIELRGPTEQQFIALFAKEAKEAGFSMTEGCGAYLVQALKSNNRSIKCCYARDIIEHCREFCEFHNHHFVLSKGLIDFALHNYFPGL